MRHISYFKAKTDALSLTPKAVTKT